MAGSFEELGGIALSVLGSFPKHTHGNIIQVCGPISTGGFNSVEINFLVFRDAVRLLRQNGFYVFDQTPLEDCVVRLWKIWNADPANSGYCWPILNEIYLPIFTSGLVGTLLFLRGWNGSTGTRWERRRGRALKLNIAPYPNNLYEQILDSNGLRRP